MLATSSAQQLGIELDPAAAVRDAETRIERASASAGRSKSPSGRRDAGTRLAAAQRREAAAVNDLAQTRRSLAERRHGKRRSSAEREARTATR